MKNNVKSVLFAFLTVLVSLPSLAQEEEAFMIRKIFDTTLTSSKAFDWLRYLSKDIGPRLSGTAGAAGAVEFTKQELISLGLDTVWLQPCMVPHWQRGGVETVRIVNSKFVGSMDLSCSTLGNSTGGKGVLGEVVEVHSLDEVEKLGQKLRGKIVFYNRPMNDRQYRTFNAYGGAVDQRGRGPAVAAKHGAVGCIVRSMTTKLDDVPHTGGTYFAPDEKTIPAMAISTKAAEVLSNLLKKEKVSVYMENNARMLEMKPSFNVIGQITGSEFPEEIILVGGHLDSWDLGEGTHDDGAGCVQSMDVLSTLKAVDYIPKRTIRCVLFMNEENGLMGAREYARVSNENGEYHIAAIESDAGGFSPRGFRCDADTSVLKPYFKTVASWSSLLEPYGLTFSRGGSGADISPLKSQKGMLFGLNVDSQRYFDYHHAASDVFETANKRELELGSAAMTSLLYLIDKNGLD